MISKSRKIRKISSTKTEDGAGAKIKRVFPGSYMRHIDPFVLLDEFFVTPEAGFPEHPHRGFEAITYMLEGAFRHKDNLGNDGIISAGGAQRFTAGSGIRHAELPGAEDMNHGLQLWINLPENLKKVDPSYQLAASSELPLNNKNGLEIRTIMGENSPIKLHTETYFLDIKIDNKTVYNNVISDHLNAIIYVVENKIKMANHSISEGEGLIIKSGSKLKIESNDRSRFVVIAGKPHNYPIRQRGSVVE